MTDVDVLPSDTCPGSPSLLHGSINSEDDHLNPSISALQPNASSAISSEAPSAANGVAIRNRDGVHIPDEQRGCLFKIALVEIIEGSLLVPLYIFVARQVSY